jgi:glutathione synthase
MLPHPLLKVGVLMDPLAGININTDSTFVLMLEAQKRGFALLYFTPQDLFLHNGQVRATVRPVTVRRRQGDHFTLGDANVLDLASLDILLMRQDPPFDMGYITATYLLERLTDRVLIVNNPAEVRSAPEKLLVTQFPQFCPPTLVSRDPALFAAFHAEHEDIVIKPLYSCGGEGVFRLTPNAPNLGVIVELYLEKFREPFIAQRYIPEVKAGDKRIILCDGTPIGAVLRAPKDGEHRANFHAGGTAIKTTLTPRETEICATIGPELRRRGLLFVGIDVIGPYLTEINVTSPTGLQEINTLNQDCLEATLWDGILERWRARNAA